MYYNEQVFFDVHSKHLLLILTVHLLQPWPPKKILLRFNNGIYMLKQ